jgi:hypothetical protein
MTMGPLPSPSPGTATWYVAGTTGSTNFPKTAGGAQASFGGSADVFVARLAATLTQNLQSTYSGGSGVDWANALALGPAPGYAVYVAGYTQSTDFPHSAGGAQASFRGGDIGAFVAQLSATLTQNPQSTYLGGSGNDAAHALAIAGSEVYVAGTTNSTDFPNTAGGAQANNGGGYDAFVARLDANLTQNPQSTYLGGSGSDELRPLAIGPSPNNEVYLAGITNSTDFPNTAGGAQASNGGSYDAFVARLSGTLTQNPQSTYLGGSGDDAIFALALGGSGEVYVLGATTSTNFPHTAGGAQPSYGGGTYDAFVARVSADLKSYYSYWLPSASHAAGLNNSQWRTDLGILNLASSRNDVQLVFYGPSGQITQTTYVAAGSQSILVDVVGQMGASGNGALEVRTSLPAIVSSRTYNLNAAGASCYPNGTLGQNLDAFTAAEGLSTGQVGVLPQLTENSQYRTNIVLTNAGTSSATVKVELYDGSGAKVGEYTETLNPGQFKQKVQAFKSVANQTNLSRGYAKVTVVAGSGVMALASVVDNVTNDPTTVRMVRP